MDDCSPGFYSHLFLVSKRDGGQRPVIDLSLLHSYLEVEHFKRETPSNNGGDATSQLGNLNRPGRHVLSHFRGQEFTEIFMLRSREQALSVQGSAIRTINSSAGLHLGHGRGCRICAPARCPVAHISGRLATPISGRNPASKGHTVPPGSMCLPRPIGEFSEVKPGSHEGVCVSRDILPNDPFHLSPVDGQMEEIVGALAPIQVSSGPVCASINGCV